MSSPLVLGPILPGDWPTSSTDPSYGGFKQAIFDSATTLLDSVRQAETGSTSIFQKGKSFNTSDCPTQTYSSSSTVPGSGNTDGFKWHVRVSTHTDVNYEQFKQGLLENHSVNERDYIEDCQTADKIQVINHGEMEVWRMLYHQPFPASNRSFSFVIFTSEVPSSSSERSFIVVSIPVAHPDAPPEKGYVRGRYVSVEQCRQTDQGVVWTMAVASDAGGMVPKMISEKAMPSKISEDVPSFLKWIKSRPAPAPSSAATTTTSGSTNDAPTLPQIDRPEAL
ncbi:SRPBCC family protein [Sporobolomyces salmoneus]|uniref:SRPBCC family protein n=1 Tax=Sporobolomyces salmoneus TaxID=183962 RepID=UPI00316F2CDE